MSEWSILGKKHKRNNYIYNKWTLYCQVINNFKNTNDKFRHQNISENSYALLRSSKKVFLEYSKKNENISTISIKNDI